MCNESVTAAFIVLTTSSSCGNIYYSYEHYQPSKITLQVLVLMIEYLVTTSNELWMM